MITNFNTYLQGCIGKLNHGWGKKALVALLGLSISVAVMSPSAAQAAASGGTLTQLEFLQWMVQLVGDKHEFNANSKADDYVNWAKVKGMTPNSGWQPGAKLERQVVAQLLVQLLKLNPKKFGGDFERILQREGIEVPAELTRKGLVELVSQNSISVPMNELRKSPSPFKRPNNGKGNGEQPPPPKNPNGNPHDNKPGHNGGHNQGNRP
jgi:hypothetical protein